MVEQDVIDYCNEIALTMDKAQALEKQIESSGERRLRWEQHQLHQREDELRQRAATSFAQLNGWKYSKASFAPRVLARGSTQHKRNERWDAGWRHELFDHPVYFRETRAPYRPVALVGQPYATEVAKARVLAMEIGLELHVPPILTASWWFPRFTRFFCFTRPGTGVAFLPDQRVTAQTAHDGALSI